jgi:serine/threonine protein kinase
VPIEQQVSGSAPKRKLAHGERGGERHGDRRGKRFSVGENPDTPHQVFVIDEIAVTDSALRDPTIHDSRCFTATADDSSNVDHGTFGSVWRVRWNGDRDDEKTSVKGRSDSSSDSSSGGSDSKKVGEQAVRRRHNSIKKSKQYVLKQTPSIASFKNVWLTMTDRRAEERRALAECETMRRLCSHIDRHTNICYAQHVWTESMPFKSSASSTVGPTSSMFVRGCLLFERKPSDLFTYLSRIAKCNERQWQPAVSFSASNSLSSSGSETHAPDYATRRHFARLGLPLESAGHILKQIIGAVAFLHTQFGLVHNDIKPENVLYDASTRHCWLTDFGGTSVPCSERGAAYDNRTATKFFASPERRLRLPFCFKSDSWSIGMLAIECVYGSVMVDRWYDQPTWNAVLACAITATNENNVREPISEQILDTLCPVPQPLSLDEKSADAKSDDEKSDNEQNLEIDYRILLSTTLLLLPKKRNTASELLSCCPRLLQ